MKKLPLDVRPLLLGLAACLAAACAPLPTLADAVCGNGVVDPGEDCDTFAPTGLACRPPDGALGCRFACTPASASAASSGANPGCPAGWGCGGDGVCREPPAAYQAGKSLVLAPASSVRLGDFDGDGRKDALTLGQPDVFGRREARVHFFDASMAAASTFDRLPLLTTPHVVDVGADGVDDLVAVAGAIAGLVTIKGSRQRSLEPLTYPTFALPPLSRARIVVTNVLPTEPSGKNGLVEVLLFLGLQAPDGSTINVLAIDQDEPSQPPLLQLGNRGPDDLVGEVRLARMLKGSTCDQLVYGFRGDPHLWVYSPCIVKNGKPALNRVASGDPAAVPPTKIALPGPLEGPIFVADMNGDGLLDVVAGLEKAVTVTNGPSEVGSTSSWVVAHGDGQLGFRSTPQGAIDQQAAATVLPRGVDRRKDPFVSKILSSGILAIGDLNLDGLPDFVTRRGVFVSLFAKQPADASDAKFDLGDPECGLQNGVQIDCSVVRNVGEPWGEAIIGDVNLDDVPDVVVAGGESGGEVLLGTPRGLLNDFRFTTTGRVSRLALGDFDGDLLRDVAFSVEGVRGVPGVAPIGDEMNVMFGRFTQPPEPPVGFGRFERIRQVIAAPYLGATALRDDLGAISRDESDQTMRVSVLAGDGQRRLVAPFGFAYTASTQSPVAASASSASIALTPARLVAGGSLDVATVGIDTDDPGKLAPESFRMWMARGGAAGTFSLPRESAPLAYLDAKKAFSGEVNIAQARFFSTSLGAGDLDGDGLDEVVHVSLTTANDAGSVLAIARATAPGADGASNLALVSEVPLPFQALNGAPVEVIDVDGDGRRDLVVLTREGEVPGVGGRVAVLWNDGKGGLDAAAPTFVAAPDGRGRVRGVAPLRRAVGAELALACEGATLIARREGRTFTIDPRVVLPGATGVAAGDMTGDGVEDLALVDGASLSVFPGISR